MFCLLKTFKFSFVLFAIIAGISKCVTVSANTDEAVRLMGYPLEKYKLQTPDRFTLGLERIPYSRYGDRTIGKPVLLVHGLFMSSNVYVLTNNSLSFSLSNAGYDVWLFNARGAGLSRTYSIYPKSGRNPNMDKMSWDFSFEEIGVYDFTTAVDFVLNKTGAAKVDVVGYSLGASALLAGLSGRPEYNKKVGKLILMAPTSRMTEYGLPLIAFHRLKFLFKYTMDKQNFFPIIQDPDTIHGYIKWMCSFKMFYPVCLAYIDMFQGNIALYSKKNVVNLASNFPEPMAKKVFLHWLQMMSSKRFSKYDYGINGNMHYYGMKTPPDYNLSKVTAPTFILHSKDDNFSASKDVKWLASKLPNVRDINYIDKIKLGHLSFVMHTNVERIVNVRIKNALARASFKQ